MASLDRNVAHANHGRRSRRLVDTDHARAGLDARDQALLALGQELREHGYGFVTPTPLTHRRVIARSRSRIATLSDVFGWSRAFHETEISASLVSLLKAAGELAVSGSRLRSNVRTTSRSSPLKLRHCRCRAE